MDHKCSKCSGHMEAGVVVDLNYAGVLPSMWVDSREGVSSGTTQEPKKKVKTVTYRCSNCGYLDSYAM